MMRIAIAGSSGLAQHLAFYIHESAHAFIILTRTPKPDLEALGYQVMVVDYESQNDLRYALRGIDLVISTISGTPQINLIDASAHAHVRCFVPSEFEGPPSRRGPNDTLDRARNSRESLERLRHYSHHNRHRMRSTVFTCGVFYEIFARGGLASKGISIGSGNEGQGVYLMNMETNTAEIVETNSRGEATIVCLTSVMDVARLVVAALELGLANWPSEYRMRGDRLTVAEIIAYGEAIKGTRFHTSVYETNQLAPHLSHAASEEDWAKVRRMQALVATAERRYDYSSSSSLSSQNLNELVGVEPMSFWEWLNQEWAL